MTTIHPVSFRWDGEAMIPLNPRLADRYYVVGETYRFEPREERSPNSHNHYFSCITEAWRNLPEHLAERFATAEHLRKHALIKAGFHDERTIVSSSKAEAQRIAAFIRPYDEYAIVVAKEATVIVYTAKSQSLRAMGRKEFAESRNAVLDEIAAMAGVEADDLRRNAGKAA